MLHRVPAPSNYINIIDTINQTFVTTLSEAGRNFKLTLIARRSRHNAGTRCLKRGINESGNVANDVETEQILSEDVPKDHPTQINSVVQNRGSIPLFWSQETSGYSVAEMSPHNSSDDDCGEYDSVEKTFRPKNVASGDYDNKPRRLQRGVLRTNFIDCLDRTNVAQYAYGWAALGQQLHALGITDATTIELDDPWLKLE
ncbi:Phosphoinositide phosphatase SAC4 [Raphanus sativus]|nr:Phosphoinositide phosphatase SAC4 [Raphanus sativus]